MTGFLDGMLGFLFLVLVLFLPLWIWQSIKNYRVAYVNQGAPEDEVKTAKIWFIIMLTLAILGGFALTAFIWLIQNVHC